jgi:hypothetical protein
MSTFVRSSKVRHLFGQEAKPETHVQDLKLGAGVGDHQYIKGNTKFFACAAKGGGGCMYVLPLDTHGKLPASTPQVTGHSSNVLDMDFNPFHENILASTSEDMTVKIWGIPEGGLTANLDTPLVNFTQHNKKVTFALFHPVAANVLGTASGDQTVKIFDIEAGNEKWSGDVPDLIQDLKWSNDGKLLTVTSKDKNAHVFDPRVGAKPSQVFEIHDGAKTSKICYMGPDSNNFVTVGFSKSNQRQFKLWDGKNLAEPKTVMNIDSAAGVLMPHYDEAINVLFLYGKGDGNVRFFEITDEAPYAYSTGDYKSTKAQKGGCFLPKRGNDVLGCEVDAFLKLHPDKVERIAMTIPRKSDKFQDDLFPDAPAGIPGCSSDEWWAGSKATQVLASLNPADKKTGAAAAPAAPRAKSAAELQMELNAANKRIADLEAELAALKSK